MSFHSVLEPWNRFQRDVWIEGLEAQLELEPGPLAKAIMAAAPPPAPPGPVEWHRQLPDGEIDQEVVGDWVPATDEEDPGYWDRW